MADAPEADEILTAANQLQGIVGQITPEEFRWQEANYDRDSPFGRELLFLIANNEWARATSETIDVTRSDAVDTMIKIDIDLDRITHEAFRHRTGRLWLPVLVLPPLSQPSRQRPQEPDPQRLPEPDPFVTLTVTDASGGLLATLPDADVRHRISAAMAEIIVNMAVKRWPDMGGQGPTATRDQRLLLSASIYRVLRREHAEEPTGLDTVRPRETSQPLPRISNARHELHRLLDSYIGLLDRPGGVGPPRGEPDGPEHHPAPEPFVQQLTRRAVRVLRAFAESAVVVVAVERDCTPTVLTVRVPSRSLHLPPPRSWSLAHPRTWNWIRPHTWRWIRPGTWNWVLPRAHLQVDLLLPSADADRQVQVNLPDGVSFDPSRALTARAEMEILVRRPTPLEHLAELMGELLGDQGDRPPSLYQCLADLAAVKADAARESLRDHSVRPAGGPTSGLASEASTAMTRRRLDELRAELSRLSARGDDAAARDDLESTWEKGGWLQSPLQRRTSADTLSPRAVVARAGMIEDVSKRAAPTNAKIHVFVAVTDAEYFSIARFSGWMSALLMTVVLVFFLSEKLLMIRSEEVSAEVLAFVLTLFSAIQAGRIERSDRSTVRGLLSLAGNGLIVASILPTVILAVALAFSRIGVWPIVWAGGCIGLQLLLQSLLWLRLRRDMRGSRRPAAGSPPQVGLSLFTDPPHYAHSEVLNSSWWRSTTADALMIGRQAYGYVVWQRGNSPTLRELLIGAQPASLSAPAATEGTPGTGAKDTAGVRSMHPNRPADVLALLRSGTVAQSLTFVVFREEPKADWVTDPHVFPVDLDPDQLAPLENVTNSVEIFLGVPRGRGLLRVADHPVTAILAAAAAHRLFVLEVQLPVPTPYPAHADLQWARVRVALRDADIARLAPFLDAICQRTAASDRREQRRGQPDDRWVVGVKTISEGGPRIINPRPVARRGSCDLVLASHIDVIAASDSHFRERAGARNWRVLAICADARGGTERDIMRRLGPDLRLAGLTYALLHGKAVVLLLAHRQGRRSGKWDDLGARFATGRTSGNADLRLDRWQSRRDLGTAGLDPLLRVHIRSPDRPGATLDVLDSLRETLQAAAPVSLQPGDWNVWHASTVVTAGNAALIRLTVRLSADPRMVGHWGPAEFEEIERKVRALAARKAAAAGNSAGSPGERLGAPEDTVISVRLITVPNPDP